ncbi:MAG: UbiX family flavin prenyltransferase [Saccharofermentanales bacterium]
MKKIIVGITGASGSVLAHRLVETLLGLGHEVHLLSTANGAEVCRFELGRSFEDLCDSYRLLGPDLHVYSNDNLFAGISSGSFKTDAMVVIPCSMGTLAKVAAGISDNLIARCADVMIKEHRQLVLVTRESPLSAIHLENMLKLARLGVTIMPPATPFYHKPETLDESVDLTIGRILETIGIGNPYHKVWGDPNEQ